MTLMLQTSDESNGLLAAVDYVNAHAEEIGAKLILEKVPDGDQGEQVIQVRYAGGEDVPISSTSSPCPTPTPVCPSPTTLLT